MNLLNSLLGGNVAMPDFPVLQPRPMVFRRQFKAFPVACANNYKSSMEEGDKILLPQSAFHELGRCLITYPMMFQVKNPKNDAKTHCGVMEFTAQEGLAYFPSWMMNGLCLNGGDIVDIQSVNLQKGTYVKFQPHKTKFTQLTNPRVVLEKALRAFSCLTKGSTIAIKHGQQEFFLDIVETKPGNAITIIDTDVNVDFAPPKDFKGEKKRVEPGKPQERKVQKAKGDAKDPGKVWGAPATGRMARANSGSSYFKKLSGGKTLSGRKPKVGAAGILRANSASGAAAKGGWGGTTSGLSSRTRSGSSSGYKPFKGKGYSLK